MITTKNAKLVARIKRKLTKARAHQAMIAERDRAVLLAAREARIEASHTEDNIRRLAQALQALTDQEGF